MDYSKYKIIEEFKNLIPPLTNEEYNLLERSILEEGVRDPLVIYGDLMIVDGHNRFEIAQKHNLDFKTVSKEFKNMDEIKIWIIENQLGRRNLNESQRAMIAARLANVQQGDNQYIKEGPPIGGTSVSQSDAATLLNVGERTIQRAKKIIDHGDKETINLINSGKLSVFRAIEDIKDLEKEKVKVDRIKVEEELSIEYDKTEDETIQIIHGDFYEYCMKMEPNSVDYLLSDLPYPKEYLHLWSRFGEVAAHVLKPSGLLISYSGQYHLPVVMNSLAEYLEYYWMFCLYHTGPSQIVNAKNVMCKWKPILIYQKSPVKKLERTIPDYVVSDVRDKDKHEWGQSESGVSTLIESFTKPNDLILDPCCGGGTTLICAERLKRRCIGIDIDENCIKTTKARLQNERN